MIDQDLVAKVKELATPAGNRVHLGNAPQDSPRPVVVIRRTGGNTPRTLSGVSLFARAQFSVNVLADRYEDAYPTANQIKDALHGFIGMLGQTDVQSSRCLSEPSDGSEIDGDKVFRWLTQDFLFVHR